MAINLQEENLKEGILALAIALVEIIRDALKHQALERVEAGSLTDGETERLGTALMELDMAVEQIKVEQGIERSVQSVRDNLDRIAGDMVGKFVCQEKN